MNIHFRAFHGPSDWGWIQQHLPLKRVEDTKGIMAIDMDTNETVGGCVLDTWTATAVQCHWILATPLVLRHGFIEEIVDYVYNVAGREVMIASVPEKNKKSRALCKHIGFEDVCFIPMGMTRDEGLHLMTMRKEQCKFWTPAPIAAEA